jgi:hypothetical membrane protein
VVVVQRWPGGVPWWGVISAAGSPTLLAGGWTVAAALQPRSFNPVADTISSLAAVGTPDRWVMTWALAGVGACYLVTGLALRPAALAGRLILMAVGVATVLVAVNPEHAGKGGSLPHTFWAAVGFIVMVAWPVAGRRRGCGAPYGLRPAVAAVATAAMLGLLAWFGAELTSGGRQVGLAERVLAEAQAIWPLVVVLTCVAAAARAKARPPGRAGGPETDTRPRSARSLFRTSFGARPGRTERGPAAEHRPEQRGGQRPYQPAGPGALAEHAEHQRDDQAGQRPDERAQW